MRSLSLSIIASEKIARDAELLSKVRGAGLRPVLTRHTACFSTDGDGHRVDHGAGFHLRFVGPGEPTHEDAEPLLSSHGLEVSLRWGGELPDGHWTIDYADGAFALKPN